MNCLIDTKYDTAYNRKGKDMATFEKLLKRILQLDKNLRFNELKKVLENCGYVMNKPGSGSSHYTFRKPGCMPITVPKHEPIKKVYVQMVKEVVEKERKSDEDAE